MNSQIDKFNKRKTKTEELHTGKNTGKPGDKPGGTPKKETINDLSDLGIIKDKIEMEAAMTDEKNTEVKEEVVETEKPVETKETKDLGVLIDEFKQANPQLVEFLAQKGIKGVYLPSEDGGVIVEGYDAAEFEEWKATKETNTTEGEKPKENEENPKDTIEITTDAPTEEKTDEKDPDWVTEYDAFLKAQDESWKRDMGGEEGRPLGLKGTFGNGATYHYTAKDKVSVKMAEGKEPTAKDFEALVALAKDKDQDIAIGGNMNEAYRKALIEACAKGGVNIANAEIMNDAEKKLYEDSKQPKEGDTTVIDEANKDADDKVSRLGELKEKYGDIDFTKGYMKPVQLANLSLRKFDRLATGNDASKQELEATLGRLEALPDVSIGGDSKESQLYTLAAYAKTFRDSKASPDNAELGEKVAKLENVLSKYGVEVTKDEKEGNAELGIKEGKGSFDAATVEKDIKDLDTKNYSAVSGKYKATDEASADKVMEDASKSKPSAQVNIGKGQKLER